MIFRGKFPAENLFGDCKEPVEDSRHLTTHRTGDFLQFMQNLKAK